MGVNAVLTTEVLGIEVSEEFALGRLMFLPLVNLVVSFNVKGS